MANIKSKTSLNPGELSGVLIYGYELYGQSLMLIKNKAINLSKKFHAAFNNLESVHKHTIPPFPLRGGALNQFNLCELA